jgi:aerobic carbon-monoxide dehydrogenase large subunit
MYIEAVPNRNSPPAILLRESYRENGRVGMMIGGSALRAAADDVIEKGKRLAAHFLEADAIDIAFADGVFSIAGTDRSMPIDQVARMSFMPMGLPSTLGVGLQGVGAFSSELSSFPNGCHICEVEIDPETGAVVVDRYAVVDDIGTVINPLLAMGQILGGIAQGAGQALLEEVAYDPATGQFCAGRRTEAGEKHNVAPLPDRPPGYRTESLTHGAPARKAL